MSSGHGKLVAHIEGMEDVIVSLKCTPEGYLIIDGAGGGGGGGVSSVGTGNNIIDTGTAANPVLGHDPTEDMLFNPEVAINFGDQGRIYSGEAGGGDIVFIDGAVFDFVDSATDPGGGVAITPGAGSIPAQISGHWVSGEFSVGPSGPTNPAGFRVLDAGGGGEVAIYLGYAFWPEVDGTAGQFLATNGDGTTVWATPPSGGATTYLQLTDTSSTYADSAQLAPVVNGAENGLEFTPNLFNGLAVTINFATGTTGAVNMLNGAAGTVNLGTGATGQLNLFNSANNVSLLNSRNGELVAFDYLWPVGSAPGVLTNNGSGELSWEAPGGTGTLQDLQSVLGEGSHALIETPEASASIVYDSGTTEGQFSISDSDVSISTFDPSDGSSRLLQVNETQALLRYAFSEGSSDVYADADGITLAPEPGTSLTLDYADWPAADGAPGDLFSTNGDGTTAWVTPAAGTATGDGPLNSVLLEATEAQPIPNNDSTPLVFGSDVYDPLGAWGGAGTGTVTVPPGFTHAQIFSKVAFNGNVNNWRAAVHRIDGADFVGSGHAEQEGVLDAAAPWSATVSSGKIPVTQGQVITTEGFQNSGGSLDALAGNWMQVVFYNHAPSLNETLIARYRARFSSPGTQTIASSTGSEALIFAEELEDTAGISSDGTTFTAPPGTTAVEIKAQATWNSNGNAGLRQIFLWQNGGFAEQQVGDRDTGVSTSLNQRNLFSSPRLPCSAGDTFQIRANQNSAANANVTSENNGTWVELEFYG